MATINEIKCYILQDVGPYLATTCSIDEAVGMMLGIMKGPDWYYDLQEEMESSYRKNTITFCLSEYLEWMRCQFTMTYFDAKESESVDDEHLIMLLNDIEQFDTDYMKRAKIYWCLIHDELSKSDSQLRTIDNGHGVKEITLASLDEWWGTAKSKTFENSIFKDMMLNNVPKVRDDKNVKELSISANVTFGLLLRAFVDQSQSTKYGTLTDANFLAVKVKLLEYLNVGDKHGQGDRSITTRLKAAEDALKKYIGT